MLSPLALTKWKVQAPNPLIVARGRGKARSDIAQGIVWNASGGQRDETPKVVVRRGGPWKVAVSGGFDGMDQVGKLDCILNEKDRGIVAHQTPVA